MANKIEIRPTSPEAMRDEIERTRARMSATIDELEVALVAKKEKIEEQLDFAARIRAKPLQTAGVVFGVGLLLGLLTGGKDGDRDEPDAEARARLWEERARRLLAITHAQEDEIDELEGELGLEEYPEEIEEREPVRDRLRSYRDDAFERLSGVASDTRERLRDRLRR